MEVFAAVVLLSAAAATAVDATPQFAALGHVLFVDLVPVSCARSRRRRSLNRRAQELRDATLVATLERARQRATLDWFRVQADGAACTMCRLYRRALERVDACAPLLARLDNAHHDDGALDNDEEQALFAAPPSSLSLFERCREAVGVVGRAFPSYQVFGWHRHDERLRALARRLLPTAAALLRTDVFLYQSSSFWKDGTSAGAGRNVATPFHADLRTHPIDSNDLVTFWCPLDAVGRDDSGQSSDKTHTLYLYTHKCTHTHTQCCCLPTRVTSTLRCHFGASTPRSRVSSTRLSARATARCTATRTTSATARHTTAGSFIAPPPQRPAGVVAP